jgi:ParB-like chromosome segregation protein Spo0J
MESLKASIKRDGFCAPILVRPYKRGRFEVVSGNHRFMAASELKMTQVPCVVSHMTERAAKRLAINLNTIHGDPNPELLAPFLAELDLELLGEIHIEDAMKKQLMDFDDVLAASLAKLEPPDAMNRKSSDHYTAVCKCPKCGAQHVKKTKTKV